MNCDLVSCSELLHLLACQLAQELDVFVGLDELDCQNLNLGSQFIDLLCFGVVVASRLVRDEGGLRCVRQSTEVLFEEVNAWMQTGYHATI